jgi:5-methylcytosine-specific restriction endonuclease McrA
MATRRVIIDGREQIDPRSTWAWRRLRDQVVREDPWCWLRLDVCTGRSQTADHLVPVIDRPDLALERTNLRGACHACNSKRKAKPLDIRPNAWVM